MAKVKNLVLYFADDQAALYRMKSEYEWLGREVEVGEDETGWKLTVLALPRKYKRKDALEAKLRSRREADEGDY